ncbi:MAG: endonuclease domain-containing protein [Cyclobacteriaceae bacterium]
MTYQENLFYGASPLIQKRARKLRQSMTAPEKILWEKLKNNSILNLKFRRQHPIYKYIVDFYCHRLRLVIEIDGEIHENTDAKEYDCNRTYELEELGLVILRFRNDEIFKNLIGVLRKIQFTCENIISPPKSPL